MICHVTLQDPFKRDNRLHSELANVSRVWPSVSRDSRMSELRMRSTASRTSMRRGSVDSVASSEKGDVLTQMVPQAGRGARPQLETVHSVEPASSGDLGTVGSADHGGKLA